MTKNLKRPASPDDGGSRKKSKGKGKEKAKSPSPSPSPPEVDSARLTSLIVASTSSAPSTSAQAEVQAAEIARLTALVARHETHIAAVQNSLTCQICLDLLYKPYTLSPCGHIACYACLVRWFTTNPDNPQEIEDPVEAIVNGNRSVDNNNNNPNGDNNNGMNAGGADRPANPAPTVGAEAWRVRYPRPPAVRHPARFIHKRKTCPLCRAIVRDRPTEVYSVKEMVGNLARSDLVELPVPPPDPSAPSSSSATPNPAANATASGSGSGAARNPHNPTNDPWNNVFVPARRDTHAHVHPDDIDMFQPLASMDMFASSWGTRRDARQRMLRRGGGRGDGLDEAGDGWNRDGDDPGEEEPHDDDMHGGWGLHGTLFLDEDDFDPEEYDDDVQYDLMGVPYRRGDHPDLDEGEDAIERELAELARPDPPGESEAARRERRERRTRALEDAMVAFGFGLGRVRGRPEGGRGTAVGAGGQPPAPIAGPGVPGNAPGAADPAAGGEAGAAPAPAEIDEQAPELGFLDREDGNIYRCLDCMHEIWETRCSNPRCLRDYPAHAALAEMQRQRIRERDVRAAELAAERRRIVAEFAARGDDGTGEVDAEEDGEEDDDDDDDALVFLGAGRRPRGRPLRREAAFDLGSGDEDELGRQQRLYREYLDGRDRYRLDESEEEAEPTDDDEDEDNREMAGFIVDTDEEEEQVAAPRRRRGPNPIPVPYYHRSRPLLMADFTDENEPEHDSEDDDRYHSDDDIDIRWPIDPPPSRHVIAASPRRRLGEVISIVSSGEEDEGDHSHEIINLSNDEDDEDEDEDDLIGDTFAALNASRRSGGGRTGRAQRVVVVESDSPPPPPAGNRRVVISSDEEEGAEEEREQERRNGDAEFIGTVEFSDEEEEEADSATKKVDKGKGRAVDEAESAEAAGPSNSKKKPRRKKKTRRRSVTADAATVNGEGGEERSNESKREKGKGKQREVSEEGGDPDKKKQKKSRRKDKGKERETAVASGGGGGSNMGASGSGSGSGSSTLTSNASRSQTVSEPEASSRAERGRENGESEPLDVRRKRMARAAEARLGRRADPALE